MNEKTVLQLKNENRNEFHIRYPGLKEIPFSQGYASFIGYEGDKPPAFPKYRFIDHYTLWEKDGKPTVLTLQPYGLSSTEITLLQAFCEKYGLEASVSARSWWNPGRALLITITRKRASVAH
jgi:hypothetical protein